MLELHRPHNDPGSDEIEDRLKEMVAAYRVFKYSVKPSKKSGAPLPHLREGDKIISGREDTDRYLNELERFMRVQHTYSADACYIDPETGEIC